MEAKFEKHFYLSPRWGIFTRLAGGTVENKNLLLNDLFRIGGLQSIRGFNENFFFADKFLYLNFEPRFYFDTYSYFMIFADMGRLENSVQNFGKDNTFSAGMGFSLETGNGVFNFIYGLGRSNAQDFSLNLSKIHFGYTGRF
jgi:hemolysin activation/secretion protein